MTRRPLRADTRPESGISAVVRNGAPNPSVKELHDSPRTGVAGRAPIREYEIRTGGIGIIGVIVIVVVVLFVLGVIKV
jgi:hypothetical protein